MRVEHTAANTSDQDLLRVVVGVAVGAVHQVLLGEVVLHVSGGGPHAGVDGGDGG